MFFGLFAERNPQSEVVNEKFDEFVTLLWKYKIGYNVSRIISAALVWGMICSVFIGFVLLILINNSEFVIFVYFIIFVLGTILSGLIEYESFGISKILISMDGNYVSAGSTEGNVYFFNKGGKLLWKEKIHGGLISSSFDGSYTAVSSEKKLKLIDVNGNLLWDFGYRTGGWFFGSDTWVKGVSVSADGSYIAAVFNWSDVEGWAAYNKIFFFDHRRNRLWDFDMNTNGTIIGVSISSNGSSVSVVKDNGVLFFNKGGNLLWEYKKDRIKGCSISSDGLYVAVISNDEVHLLDREGRFLWSNKTGGMIKCVSISSDGSCIAAGSNDNNIYFFNKNGNLLWKYKTDGAIQSIIISQEYSFTAVGSKDNRVYFFNRDGVLLWKYKTGGEVDSVSVSPDGSYIAVGSKDKEVYFFKFDIDRAGKLKT